MYSIQQAKREVEHYAGQVAAVQQALSKVRRSGPEAVIREIAEIVGYYLADTSLRNA